MLVSILNSLLLTLVLLTTSCGGKKKTESKFVLNAGAFISGGVQPGGVIVWGEESSGLRMAKTITSTSDTIELDNGTWNFYAMSWVGGASGESLEGAVSCGKSLDVNLSGGDQDVFITVTNDGCNDAIYGDLSFWNGTDSFHPLYLTHCAEGTDVSAKTAGGVCTGGEVGNIGSFKIKLPEFIGNGDDIKPGLESECFQSSTPTNIKVPLGAIGSPVFSVLEIFSGSTCNGYSKSSTFPRGLSQSSPELSSDSDKKAIYFGTGSYNQYFLSSSFYLSPPSTLSLSVPASSPGSDTTPTILVSGNLTDGLDVSLYSSAGDGGTKCDNLIGTATVSAGAATVTVSTPLTEGTHEVYAIQSDTTNLVDSVCSSAFITYQLDSTGPSVSSFAKSGAQLTPTNNNTINFDISFDEQIDLSTFTATAISNGAGHTANNVTWSVTHLSGNTSFRISAGAMALGGADDGIVEPAINMAVIKDIAGNFGAGTNTSADNVVYDSQGPQLSTFSVTQGSGVYGPGDSLTIQVTFTDATTMSSSSGSLSLNNGQVANYTGMTGGVLSFNYTIGSAQDIAVLDYASVSALATDLQDAAGNSANLVLPTPGGGSSIGNLFAVEVVDAPKIVNVLDSTGGDGNYKVGEVVKTSVVFDKAVNVSGVPTLPLSISQNASYVSGTNSTTLVFEHTVMAGDNTNLLDNVNPASLSLNGGSIVYYNGAPTTINANLALPSTGSGNSLSDNSTVIIDTQAPSNPTLSMASNKAYMASFNITLSASSDTNFDNYYWTIDGGTPICGSANSGATVTVDATAAANTHGNQVNVRVIACDIAGNQSTEITHTYTYIQPSVEPYYANAPNWNDYIDDKTSMSSIACSSPTAAKCYHGGGIRKVDMSAAVTDCTGMTASDNLGALSWKCDDAGANVIFIGKLAPGKGLKDLVDATAWKSLSVTINGGTQIIDTSVASIASTSIWNNPVSALPVSPSAVTALSGAIETGIGPIYTYSVSQTTMGYTIGTTNAHKIGIVNLGGAGVKLQKPVGTPLFNCKYADGSIGSNESCMFVSQSSYYQWFEGVEVDSYDANIADRQGFGFSFNNIYQSVYKDISVSGSFYYGISLTTSNYLDFKNVKVRNVTDAGDFSTATYGVCLNLETGSGNNKFSDIHLSNCGDVGLSVYSSSSNIFDKVLVQNTGAFGIDVFANSNSFFDIRQSGAQDSVEGVGFSLQGNDNILSQLITANNTYGGLEVIFDSSNNLVTNITAANIGDDAIFIGDATDTTFPSANTFENLLAVNNTGAGVHSYYAEGSTFRNIVSGNNGIAGVQEDFPSTTLNTFEGFIKGSNNGTFGNCYTDSATQGGLAGLNNGDCTALNNSNSTFTDTPNIPSVFMGKTATLIPYSSTADWLAPILNPGLLLFGVDGTGAAGAAPSLADNIGTCLAGSCRMWDFSYKIGDSIARNTFPAKPVLGDQETHTFSNASTITYMPFARELMPSDGSIVIEPGYEGNDNGICEAGEACVYAANVGAYQGHGAITRSSGDDVVSGMFAYPNDIHMYTFNTNGF